MTISQPQEPLKIVAGWGENTHVFPSLEYATYYYAEVFNGSMMDPDYLEKELGITVVRAWEDDEEVFYLPQPLTLVQARALVDLVNQEGNYEDFVFRPAWPDENVNPKLVANIDRARAAEVAVDRYKEV